MALVVDVRVFNGDISCGTCLVECDEDDSVSTLKGLIAAREGIPVDRQRLTLYSTGGRDATTRRVVKDEHSQLSGYFTTHQAVNTVLLQVLPQESGPSYTLSLFPRGTEYMSCLFIIDVSGSMNARIIRPDGTVTTRYEHLLVELESALMDLPDKAMFNVIYFSTEVFEVWDSLRPACEANVNDIMEEMKDLVPGGGTNAREALRRALSYPECQSFYFVTDGRPDTPVEEILQMVSLHNEQSIPVHCIGMLNADADLVAQHYLRALARSTGGTYRCPRLPAAPTPPRERIRRRRDSMSS